MAFTKTRRYGRPRSGALEGISLRGALGFTPEEEKEVLLAARSEVAEEKKMDEMLEFLREQERIKMITAGATIVGLLYTLAKMGEFVADMRKRRREST